MPIALLLAAALAQTTPANPAPSVEDVAAASTLPKDDYGLVAWCHGALAGQLELDPIAHADMISIEGKAKVAARAKSDAEMEKDRRAYLHDYERALAAAEKASPTAIHQYGVESELSGYKLWGATRQKQPIWRMLDWGMWDPNDAGCGDAAKRLYNKATLFGEALKGSGEDKAPEAGSEPAAPLPPAFTAHDGAPVSDAAVPATTPAAAADETSATPPAETPAVVPAPDAAASTPVVKPAKAKTKGRSSGAAKAKAKAPAAPPTPETAAPTTDAPTTVPGADQPAPPATDPLRGPQS